MCQQEKLAGLGMGFSSKAGMNLPFHRFWVRGAQTSGSWAEWGLPGSPDGDIPRAAAFLDKTHGNQAAEQTLTSRPDVLECTRAGTEPGALFSTGLCGEELGMEAEIQSQWRPH